MDLVKNALLLGLDAALIRTSYCDEDISKRNHNSIAGRMGMHKEIKELAKNAKIRTKVFLQYYV